MINFAKLSYLIVDHDSHNRQILSLLIRRVLGSDDVMILETSEGFNGRLQQFSPRPSIIFISINMHPLDGYQMLRIIKDAPTYQSSKIVAVTAQVMPEDIAAMKKAGFDALISKPIIRSTFSGLIQRIWQNQPVWYVA
ncbi:MAG: response regulator [Chloroflexi bacterium]|nr:response regulator [Chloroflexota bacterium]